ncbi:MAG: dihydroorotate dehydrogenase electron transfer subunit [Oscillospiraceae bacterium]
MPIQQICTICAITRLNDYAYHFVLEAGKMGTLIRPGQFLHIKCGNERLLRRPISICEWQEDQPDDLVSIVFEVRGEGTDWLANRQEGDKLDVLGPLGNGFSVDCKKPYLVVGGGIGVPPILGATTTGSTAVLGCRSADRIMPVLTDKFKERCKEVLLYSDDGTVGTHGFVDAGVRKILSEKRDFAGVLACGPRPMLRAVSKVAEEFNIPCQVSMEERMACGVGACLGCAIQMADGTMKHVCKDGPVFDSREVLWNA